MILGYPNEMSHWNAILKVYLRATLLAAAAKTCLEAALLAAVAETYLEAILRAIFESTCGSAPVYEESGLE